MKKELEFYREVERSLQKKYRKVLWSPFTDAVKKYQLIQEGDRIAVCISGGKDSMLLAKLMQQLEQYGPVRFTNVFLCMDPGYNPENRRKIEENAALLHIPVQILESDIFRVANSQEKNPCYLCARMRRGFLYAKAKSLGCNKIALGHHFNDVIETTLIGMFYASQLQAMLPKLHSDNFEGMELIRPLYQVHEDDIIAWKNYHGLEFLQCACRFTEDAAGSGDGIGASKRQEVKQLIREMKKTNREVDVSIFNSIHAVCLETMPGWKERGKQHSFLENYED